MKNLFIFSIGYGLGIMVTYTVIQKGIEKIITVLDNKLEEMEKKENK